MRAEDVWNIHPLSNPASANRGFGYRITVLTDKLLRLEYEPENRFRDSATYLALNRDFPVPEFTVTREDSGLKIETDFLRLAYDEKRFSSGGLSIMLKGTFGAYASVWHFGEKVKTMGGTARTLDEADGEIPLNDGIQSLNGYTVLDDSHSMGMDAHGRLLPAREHGLDLYFFGYGHDFKACLHDFLLLSGPVPPVPRFALGNWWSRFYRYSSESYLSLMNRFRQENIPLSVAILDMNWHVTDIDPKYGPGWTGYTWDRSMFPDPEGFLRELHKRGLRVGINEHPADGIRPCEEWYPSMAQAMGDDPGSGRTYPYDAANESFQQAFEDCVQTPLEKQGVDFWWIDWQQQGGTSDEGMDPLATLNHTRYLHTLRNGQTALILSRYGGPGSHRYPMGFSGDSFATWESLAFQPYFTATAANIGYTWWSHDIGGHMHGKSDPELTLRWLQFGVFSPVMRLHSTNNPFIEKEPWTFPPLEASIMKEFLRLRHRLIPWLYSQNLIFSRQLEAMLRPVYYDFPQPEMIRSTKNQYLLGDMMMVCPITKPADPQTHLGEAAVRLPEGIWTDFFTGYRYRGGRALKMYRPLDSIPVLVREGAILPMDESPVPENGASLPKKITFHLYPGAAGKAELIEDNGRLPQDPAYRQAVTRIRMTCGDTFRLEIDPPEGDFSLIPEGREYELIFHGARPPFPDAVPVNAGSHPTPAVPAYRLNLAGDIRDGILLQSEALCLLSANRNEILDELLHGASLDADLKWAVMHLYGSSPDPAPFLAQLHTMKLPDSLYGAILEMLNLE